MRPPKAEVVACKKCLLFSEKKYYRPIFIAGPCAHSGRQKDNWRSWQQTQRDLDGPLLSVLVLSGPLSISLDPGPKDTLGKAPWALDCHFKLYQLLIAESDLKILGSVPGVFQELFQLGREIWHNAAEVRELKKYNPLCLNLHEVHTVQLISFLIGTDTSIMYCVSFHFEIN